MALLGNLTGSSQYFNDRVFYNGVATQSLRFDDGSSAYLTRTPSGAGNRTTWTWSGWVKLGVVTIDRTLFGAGTNGDNQTFINLGDTDKLVFNNEISNSRFIIQTDAVFRDVSAWYHVVLAVDTTQSTDTNRVKIYVNGELQTLSSVLNGYPNQNVDTFVNATNEHEIGSSSWGPEYYNDGYMAEVNFVDGTQLTPSSFGETKNGVWIPIKYTGSYGTNGFRLQFDQTGVGTASTSTIGADTSGNTHHFTSSGIVASDCNMPDSPENNFVTWNVLSKGAGTSTAEGNLKAIYSSNNQAGISSTFSVDTGKYYFEVGCQTASVYIGVAPSTYKNPDNINSTAGSIHYSSGGNKSLAGTETSYGASYGNGDVIGVALNLDDGEVTFYKNNSSQGALSLTSGLSYGISSASGSSTSTFTVILNSGQDSSFAGTETAQGNTDAKGIGDFYYAPPSGFLALCTSNLPEPTISPNALTQADDYFNTVLYTGNGSSTHAITGVGFQADFNWLKERSSDSAPMIHDVIRETVGAGTSLNPDRTDAESTNSTRFKSFDSDGFTVGSNTGSNESGETYVAWNWKAGGTAASNTDGTITSSVSANTDAGFSIVTYTGNGSAGATYGHGLGAVPAMIITKGRNVVDNWMTRHKDYSANTSFIELNTTNAEGNATDVWNNTAPTSSVISVGTGATVNSNTKLYVSYCFAEVEGYSKFGSYTGNGNADGTFVYTGFRPAWVMFKRTDGAGNSWGIKDIVRDSTNPNNGYLFAESANAEGTATSLDIDFLSNGLKFRGTSSDGNGNGNTYIYMAFAEAPFKYANAR